MDRLFWFAAFALLFAATVSSEYPQGRVSAQPDQAPFVEVPDRIVGRAIAEPSNERIASSGPQTATLASGSISYRAYLNRTLIEDRHDVFPPADVYSFSYQADGNDEDLKRPVVFLFNGGPGSSSIWLHTTGLGPYKTSADLLNPQDGVVPLEHEENPGFLIDVADLVFVDPVGTGLSRVIGDASESAFKDLRVDARAMCKFAQNWLEAEDRIEAPVFIVGVSYSTLRAAGMASHPNCKNFGRNLSGLIFVSGLLDLRMRHAHDVSGRVSRYPTIAAIAWQRGLVDRARWPSGMQAFLTDMEAYANTVIGPSLTQAHLLSEKKTRQIIEEMHTQIGLDAPDKNVTSLFTSMRLAKRRAGRAKAPCGYDARFDCGRVFGPHPNLELYQLGDDLERILVEQWRSMTGYELNPETYTAIRRGRFGVNWDYRFLKSGEIGAGTDMAHILSRKIKRKHPFSLKQVKAEAEAQVSTVHTKTRIMVASGLYDLVTPYYAMELALLRAGFAPSQFEVHLYEGGHMMYLEKETGHQFANDIRSFILGGE